MERGRTAHDGRVKLIAPRLRTLAIALPIVFAMHMAEEAPGFVAWFNSLVTAGITQRTFLSVNATGLVITLAVASLAATSRDTGVCLVAIAWVGFLMVANGLLHLVGTLVHWRYAPGVITGTLLYLPLSVLFMRAVVRECAISWRAVLLTALAGGVPMYIHGYLIVFRGNRLC
jgi:hypothetical protein